MFISWSFCYCRQSLYICTGHSCEKVTHQCNSVLTGLYVSEADIAEPSRAYTDPLSLYGISETERSGLNWNIGKVTLMKCVLRLKLLSKPNMRIIETLSHLRSSRLPSCTCTRWFPDSPPPCHAPPFATYRKAPCMYFLNSMTLTRHLPAVGSMWS